MSPEEQQSYLVQLQEHAKTTRYWRRNAAVTFIALIACVLASAFVQPMHWPTVISFGAAGVAFYVGWATDNKGHETAGGLVMVGAALASVGLVWLFALRGPLMWVQGFGVMVAAFCGALVFHQATQRERNGDV